jgi:hypothetical protein
LYDTGKLTVASLEYEVVVVGHQAIREATVLRSPNRMIEAAEEVDAIGVERENGLSIASPRVYVVDPAGDEVSGWSAHGGHGTNRTTTPAGNVIDLFADRHPSDTGV